MPENYFAIGTTLANLQNIEAVINYPPHVLPGMRIPLLGPIRQRTLDHSVQRNGSIDVPIQFDVLSGSDLNTFILEYWGDYLTASVSLFASWLDETAYRGQNNYSPFSVELERPVIGEHYQDTNGTWRQQIIVPGLNWTLQSNTENSTTTLTTSQRYVLGDTTAGAIDWTLPAANAVNADTVFSGIKSGGGNTLQFLRAGSDTIDGSTSLAITGRTNIISNGVDAWSTI